jgi:formylglycine-generating enzyme required for sulfatase activity
MNKTIESNIKKDKFIRQADSQITRNFIVIDLNSGKITEFPKRPADLLTNDVYKTTKMVLKKIPHGTFIMGSPESETGREPFGKGSETQHNVTLSRDFYMAVFQCTQGQYKLITGYNPNEKKYEGGGIPKEYVGDKLVVGNISWYNARGGTWPGGDPDPSSFIGKLQYKTGIAFDLPTEAQWEYACRAGTIRAYNNDKDCLVGKLEVYEQEINADAQDTNLDPLANYRNNTYCLGKGPQEVGKKKPNKWRLYDMHGNSWEWCLDLYEDYSGDVTDPVGALSGSVYRVKRGGCGNTQPHRCRSANRSRRDPSDPYIAVGWSFRIVLTID